MNNSTLGQLEKLYLLYQRIEKLKLLIKKDHSPCKLKCQIFKRDFSFKKKLCKLRQLVEKIKLQSTVDDKNHQILHIEILLKDSFEN